MKRDKTEVVKLWVERLMMQLILTSLLQLNLALDRGSELTHNGIHSVAEGLGYVPQLTFLDIRSAVFSKHLKHGVSHGNLISYSWVLVLV